MPSYSSDFAAEGTLAHEVAERILNGANPYELKDEYDYDMLTHVMLYTDYVKALQGDLLVEHRFHLKDLHEDLFGTADAVVWDEDTRALHCVDLKYGAGVGVEVSNNPQLLYYALGALLETKRPAKRVVMTIVQPRCPHPDGPIRSWEIPAMDLLDWSADLVEAAKRTQEPDAPLNAGEHCRWCPAAAVCPKLLEKAQATAKLEFRQDFSYDPKQLADSLELADVVELWVKAVREFAYQEANHGRPAPGWKLVEKRATRKWMDEQETVKALHDYGMDDADIFDRKIKTPAVIEKVVGKEGKEFLETLVVRESSGTTLVHESDSRPAVRSGAADDFSGN